MRRFLFAFALFVVPVAAAAASGVISANGPCRPEYVIPYADQCTFAYHGIHHDHSPKNLQNAFMTCDRSQSASVACVKSPTKQIHVIALDSLYTSVSAQSEIAMFAGQYALAETLLREKLSVIDAIGREARAGDAGLAAARASTHQDLQDSIAGECTWKALSTAGLQQQDVQAHRYADLSTLLTKKASDYSACAKLASTPQHKAYVEYLGFVALEEGGRAAQAAGERDAANRLYKTCIDGTLRSAAYAGHTVKGELSIVTALCRGRLSGRYRVDQPEPIDADNGKRFRPLTLPKA
jgi:hypothetical protein